ncbi:MAG TPA: DUF2249 domain-containing protein [Candidatus Desulfobacillus sp.]|nr:DUF2249 domain-containing protein [Candidatus Desulfobacillus sp.]
MQSTANCKTTIDIRTVPVPESAPRVFAAFDDLSPGEALLLVDDHDPKLLFDRFQAESRGQFTWDRLENGPRLWRIRVGKLGEDELRVITPCSCTR